MSSRNGDLRPDLYVIARIIEVLKKNGPTKRTPLARDTGLAYDRLLVYLEWMERRNLIRVNEEGEVILTEEGLRSYDAIVDWILKYVGKIRFRRYTNP